MQGNDYMDYNPENIPKDILIEVPDANVIIDVPNKPGIMVEVEKWTLDDGDEQRKFGIVSPQQGQYLSSVPQEIDK